MFILWLKRELNLDSQFNMDHLQLVWGCEFIFLIKWLVKASPVQRTIVIAIILSIPCLRGPVFAIFTYLVTILSLGECNISGIGTRYLFNTCIQPKWLGHTLPDKPTIFVINYPTNYIEYMVNQIIDKKICIVVNKNAIIQYKAICLFYPPDNIIEISYNGSYKKTLRNIKRKMNQGYNIMSYVEKSYFLRPTKYSSATLRSGMFSIAYNLGATITPIVFDHIDHSCGIISHNNYKIYVDSTRTIDKVEQEMENVSRLFTRKLNTFKYK